MKSLRKFSKGIVRHLMDDLNHFALTREPGTLHKIRVEIKKIKAVLNAVNASRKKFKAHKAFLPFRNIFRKAGAIRGPEVLQELLTRYPIGIGVEDTGETKKSLEAFLDDVPFFVETVFQQWKEVKPFVAGVGRKKLRAYVKMKEKEVRENLSPKAKPGDIHKVRKAMKEVIYLSKVTGSLSRRARTFYSKLEEAIGQWHDKQVLLSYSSKLNGTTDKVKVAQLRSASLKDKKNILKLAVSGY